MKSKIIPMILNITALVIILTVAISYLFLQNENIRKPYIFLVGACFVALDFKNYRTQLLQHLTIFYLFMILAEPLSSKFFIMQLVVSDISVPISFFVLLAFTILYAVSKINRKELPKYDCENFPLIITISIILIAAQMLVLFFMLRQFYGYGYEYNFSVLGKLVFVALMFLFMRQIFETPKFRRLSAIILAVIIIILTLKGLSLPL